MTSWIRSFSIYLSQDSAGQAQVVPTWIEHARHKTTDKPHFDGLNRFTYGEALWIVGSTGRDTMDLTTRIQSIWDDLVLMKEDDDVRFEPEPSTRATSRIDDESGWDAAPATRTTTTDTTAPHERSLIPTMSSVALGVLKDDARSVKTSATERRRRWSRFMQPLARNRTAAPVTPHDAPPLPTTIMTVPTTTVANHAEPDAPAIPWDDK